MRRPKVGDRIEIRLHLEKNFTYAGEPMRPGVVLEVDWSDGWNSRMIVGYQYGDDPERLDEYCFGVRPMINASGKGYGWRWPDDDCREEGRERC